MIQSMTGFGSALRGGYKVDIRSLNSKHMDIHCRLPNKIIHMEMGIRKSIRDKFHRGKFDVYVQEIQEDILGMRLNENILPTLYSSISNLKEKIGYTGEISVDTILQFRDVLFVDEQQSSDDDVMMAVDEALSKLMDMRCIEGKSIKENLLNSLDRISHLIDAIESLTQGALQNYKARLISKITDLFNELNPDEHRLYQEALLMVMKSDINEEISRLKSHINQFKIALEIDVAGKKLEFLTQEMLREANTMSQKSDDIGIINHTIDLKTEIDRIKEQVQNIQ